MRTKISLFLFIFSCHLSFAQTKITTSAGHIKFVKLNLGFIPNEFYLTCPNKKKIPLFMVTNEVAMTYISESYFSSRKKFSCYVKGPGHKTHYLAVRITPYSYPKEQLSVNRGKVFLSAKNLKRVRAEQKVLNKIYKNTSPVFLFDSSFKKPLDSILTSYYGVRRLFNKKKKGQHLGNDFRAATGTPIPASNSGTVVLAQELFYSGNTVILDHGMGIFSTYGHLNQIKVKQGVSVKEGEILGLAGSTGRVTGPHLHWGVKVHGNWIDGIVLVEESRKHLSELNKLLSQSY